MERQDRQNSHLYYVFTTERSSEISKSTILPCKKYYKLISIPLSLSYMYYGTLHIVQ